MKIKEIQAISVPNTVLIYILCLKAKKMKVKQSRKIIGTFSEIACLIREVIICFMLFSYDFFSSIDPCVQSCFSNFSFSLFLLAIKDFHLKLYQIQLCFFLLWFVSEKDSQNSTLVQYRAEILHLGHLLKLFMML